MTNDHARQRILLIDDEPHIADVVEYVLREQGLEVRSVRDGEAALALNAAAPPDLVILDLGLPGLSGLDVLRRLRAERPTLPVIILTARSDELDRVVGLELGADDYVTKPFSARELAARVRAVLRRTSPGAPLAGPAHRLVHGPLAVDTETFAVTFFAAPLTLTRAEFRLLECLVRYPARVFTRETLINKLYDGEHVVTDRSVDACIKRLRRKFAEVRPAPDPVETVHGLGYKLSPELDRAGA